MVKSHSEAEIVKGCIELMWDLVGEFEDYLDFLGIDVTEIPEDERFEDDKVLPRPCKVIGKPCGAKIYKKAHILSLPKYVEIRSDIE